LGEKTRAMGVKSGNGTGGGDGRCSGCGWRTGGGDGRVFWVVKWWLGALGMREERRGWERGLYGVRGNEVEKEKGDLKRSRGGSESSALDRTKVRSIALEQKRVVRARSALGACFVALCVRAYTVWCVRGVHCGCALWLYAREHT
jgi:hypothetical protein